MDKLAYKYSIDECDFLDKVKGEAFRKMRLKWIEWLHGEDPFSISRQISSMLWDYALFITINELRRMAESKPLKDVGFNGPVIRLFDAGFATTQAVAIRRLIEKPKKDPKWAVISLRQVLKEIEKNLDLMTRENYVCYDGLPYDYGAVQDKWLSSLPKTKSGVHSGSLPTSGPYAFVMSERVHKSFDILAQVNPQMRSRNDVMRRDVLDHLESELKKCENVKKYVDKFIAHAAAPETIASLSEEEKGLTLDRLESCHKTIYQVASFISVHLLWESNIGGVPVPQYDHLKYLDKKWATSNNLIKAHEKWKEYEKAVCRWDSTPIWPPGFKIEWGE
ncbi:MAG TPA: hypothetical protein PLK94_06000 [Alphaproteobacteria bacterium]|nr:hypothetical protein [Alphaproteobacteria bacterium]HPQ44925.1 hypothetical protein [Syntrophales bacterium]